MIKFILEKYKKLIGNTYDVKVLGILERDIDFCSSLITLIWNSAFLSGRSKHGNARRASIGENCVLASHLNGSVKHNENLVNITWLGFITSKHDICVRTLSFIGILIKHIEELH